MLLAFNHSTHVTVMAEAVPVSLPVYYLGDKRLCSC